jgi:hypothetical protein
MIREACGDYICPSHIRTIAEERDPMICVYVSVCVCDDGMCVFLFGIFCFSLDAV